MFYNLLGNLILERELKTMIFSMMFFKKEIKIKILEPRGLERKKNNNQLIHKEGGTKTTKVQIKQGSRLNTRQGGGGSEKGVRVGRKEGGSKGGEREKGRGATRVEEGPKGGARGLQKGGERRTSRGG